MLIFGTLLGAVLQTGLSHEFSFAQFDFLLWPYKELPLHINRPDGYFWNATVVDTLFDAAVGDVATLQSVKPGGVVLTETSAELLKSLHHVAFMQPYGSSKVSDAMRPIKLAVVAEGQVAFIKKGFLDDNDHMSLGDYGNEYGEYRWGVFMRFVQRMLRHPGGRADSYFTDQLAFFAMPISSVNIDLTLAYDEATGTVTFRTRSGKRLDLSLAEFRRLLLDDMSFALTIHPERIAITMLQGKVRITVTDTEVVDYELHPKKKPWKTYTSYFGGQKAQSLAVVAHTAHEKSLMVGDDLSDFYTGRITSAVPEGAVKVSVLAPSCEDFKKSLKLHRVTCKRSQSGVSQAPAHSPLYSLAAKEKLSGELGVAAESSMKRIFDKFKNPWPRLMSFHIEGESATLEEFEGRRFTRGKAGKLAKRLKLGVDIVHTHDCELPKYATSALVPGGLILVEGLSCQRPEDFQKFLQKAIKLGSVAVGRRIAVVRKSGLYFHDARRVKWPQLSEQQEL